MPLDFPEPSKGLFIKGFMQLDFPEPSKGQLIKGV